MAVIQFTSWVILDHIFKDKGYNNEILCYLTYSIRKYSYLNGSVTVCWV